LSFETAFVSATRGGPELLYGSGYINTGLTSDSTLGTIDTSTFAWNLVAGYQPPFGNGETEYVVALTGTGDGRLFALTADGATRRMFVARIDPTSADVLTHQEIPGLESSPGGIVFWGGYFFTFLAYDHQPVVSRFDPRTGNSTPLHPSGFPGAIQAAAASTCAPLG
jgi:hypothetical protein